MAVDNKVVPVAEGQLDSIDCNGVTSGQYV